MTMMLKLAGTAVLLTVLAVPVSTADARGRCFASACSYDSTGARVWTGNGLQNNTLLTTTLPGEEDENQVSVLGRADAS
jgi:hypothetical protein